jgi:hypothetical protein
MSMHKAIVTFAIGAMVFSLPISALAQTNTGGGQGGSGVNTGTTLINPLNTGNCNSATGDCLMKFLQKILELVVRVGAILVILMLVFVGFKFVVARGDPGAIKEARGALLWTVVGALILLGAQVIATGIEATVKALAI